MSYDYQTEKPSVFTENGQRALFHIRDNVNRILPIAGAVRFIEATAGCRAGDSWTELACVDYLVELGVLREIPQTNMPGQHRIFVKGRN